MSTDYAVDLTNCDREPIHILGTIQPSGFLLALTSDWMVARASVNLPEFIGRTVDDVLGQSLDQVFTPQAVHDLRNRTTMLRGPDSVERMFDVPLVDGKGNFDVAIHYSGRQIVIEAEPSRGHLGDVTSIVRSMFARLDQCQSMTAFYREGARQIRALIQFDRVMVYRFAADGSGEVVAEACRPGIGQFLGLHYPATDIPVQARQLYLRNMLRVIGDVHAKPVPIHPALDENGAPLDMSLSLLRSVSPIHIEYLKNMGVDASLSISIIVDGKLWGLFACHHYSANNPNFERRAVAELFAQMFCMRLESRERQATVEYERRARDISDQLLGAVASDEALLRDPDWLADILTHAIPADGVGVWLSGGYAFSGQCPPTEDFRRIVRALNATAAGKVYATDNIGSLVPDAEHFSDKAAGLLAIPISRSPRDYVVLFRSEMVRSVRWAGDPHKPVEYGPNGPRLTPRQSFAEWKELVRGKSQPFTTSELRVAETLRATLIEVVLRLSDEATAERQQAGERQELLIAELNHRVRNILGLIRGLIRQSQASDPALSSFVKLIDGRIHALARAHNQITEDHWGPAPLQSLIDAEAAAFMVDATRIRSSGEPVMLNPLAYTTLALVLHELVTNSNKYGSLSLPDGHVSITWSFTAKGDLCVQWREIGGPPVKQPKRKGFGTTIIQRSVPYDLGGEAHVRFAIGGFEADLLIPKRHVAEASGASRTIHFPKSGPGHAEEPPMNLLAGQRVLLVEDSLIIALDAEDIVSRLGAQEIVTAGSVDAALDLIDTAPPTVAMLDINLGIGTSFPIADVLHQLDIPFIFATGYGEQAKFPDVHRARPVVQKPYTIGNVARALAALLPAGEISENQ
ncbi:HWE histidine kinase domain-containing protein [Novosphingobium taihuense]|uniref:histidine kinase n=1 Tax=Novosphingobium taihuense TaxID=260085 RepID=A0A7W7A7C6_9SPHN|nr:HWE histidine kinase domain-containing protein [Novosphingobium taihuense]MBB4611799.1 light-regulated signal transduction histidine kinase (bacteriophytochrome)/CheY-like chemotaxis protein [Novosphingobium taihuense]TWH88846.1 light-regulated signal transduction histidine kinase (bacteriophytochrome) [Novosphingobium taihuense]